MDKKFQMTPSRPTIAFLSSTETVGAIWPGIQDGARAHGANLVCFTGNALNHDRRQRGKHQWDQEQGGCLCPENRSARQAIGPDWAHPEHHHRYGLPEQHPGAQRCDGSRACRGTRAGFLGGGD